ncbi:restriction endonuclease [Candidatus Aalborgicola defluviihabitans]|uniref:restriction endonuclease n=2 Tax=Candidatus Aalborgicola defluviihabitans TaxID=3386187 RepID=UPI001D837983|nr:restriction endonuclease [Burkholderiales bacterium]MBK6570853.1 restriction endonuclease [Burkholderiales bacterium]MBK7279843.1 restriction endonuclease [Burkholderiales bacterium]
MVMISADPIEISPAEFELAVKGILDAASESLVSYQSKHLDALSAADGDYIIDVTATFKALGAEFCVLVECKHHKRKVERQDVQVLHAKLLSLGAQKAMLFSTSAFQSGAIEFADAHGIALVQLASGASTWFTRSAGETSPPPAWANNSTYVGWWHHGNCRTVLSDERAEYIRQALGIPQLEP